MKKQKIYFDLDHTLWDYETNARETLEEIFFDFEINRYFVSPRSFVNTFHHVNWQLWDLYNRGEIDKSHIRSERFKRILEGRADYADQELAEISNYFITECPKKNTLMPGALNVVEYLSKNYRLGIITNGFDETQNTKLVESELLDFFEIVVTSESAGFRKPDPRIFEFALGQSALTSQDVLMIGDNLKTDILGAKQSQIEAIWYNPELREGDHDSKISHLDELLDLL